MSVLSRQTRCPRPYDPDLGRDAAARIPDLDPGLGPLVQGAAGCSPYLAGLIGREHAWIGPALNTPEAAMADVVRAIAALPPDQAAAGLRQAKRRVALLAGLADLAGAWSVEQVTGALTDLADAATDAALKTALTAQIRRNKLPGMTQDDVHSGASVAVLAMGKMGAHELNYSSDIDLICLFDDARFDGADIYDARAALIRATRMMVGLLADVTGDGYVFRTDLRLRPDPSVTPVCVPMSAAETYYESVGRTWERAAYIKARPAAGDLAAGAAFLEALRPFVWRKHLDFAAIQDAHDMRLKIRDHKGLGGALVLEGHNMKLGRGGIREIEFFAQTQQLIAGGRDDTLRVRGTVPALRALTQAGWLPEALSDQLVDHYRFHRCVEHRLQMVQDAQTHDLPLTPDGFDRIAHMMDMTTPDLRAALSTRLEAVHTATEGFFAPDPSEDHSAPDYAEEIIAKWPGYPALRSGRATEIFNRLRPQLFRRLDQAADPAEALRQFDNFLSRLPAGVQIFSLFDANPSLTQLIVDICARAPALATYLGHNPNVLDAVLGGQFFAPWPDADALADDMRAALSAAPDYEDRLNAARRWMKETHFRIGVHLLRGLIDGAEAGAQYADLAACVLRVIYPETVAQFAEKHGSPPGHGAAVLAMGSLGAGRIHAASDLDLIVVYDADGVEASEGRKPLATRAYYARLTQALITALKAQMPDGMLYDVDMRLRPSGRQGPVATALSGFISYQMTDAWTWEHLALTRARVVAGAPTVAQALDRARREVLAARAGDKAVLGDLIDMRARIAQAKRPDGPWDVKLGPGRLQDIELLAQSLALRAGSPALSVPDQLAAGAKAGMVTADQAACLSGAAAALWRVQAVQRLISAGPFDPATAGRGATQRVLREIGAETDQGALDYLGQITAEAQGIIDAHLRTASKDSP